MSPAIQQATDRPSRRRSSHARAGGRAVLDFFISEVVIMRFFVPTANDPSHARALHSRIRERVVSAGHAIADSNIFRIRYNHNARRASLAVGDSYHELEGDPVFAIFKAPSYYVVCTRRHGALDGEPVRIEQDKVNSVEEFE